MRYSEGRTATVLAHHMKSLNAHDAKSGSNQNDNLNDRAYISPTGSIYVSEDVVKGVLPQILDEMLTTRAMLKRAAKEYKKSVPDLSPAILRQLEARQLALKYVANVTYGKTINSDICLVGSDDLLTFCNQDTHLRRSAEDVRCHFLQILLLNSAVKRCEKRLILPTDGEEKRRNGLVAVSSMETQIRFL
jgi:hypothetical protein